MAILIRSQIRQAILANALICHPEESCGLLAGPASDDVRMAYPLTNILHSPTNYTIDPEEHFRSLRHAERSGWDLVGVFHSHPQTGAYPSPTDIRLAADQEWLYLLVGMEHNARPEIRGFRIVGGAVTEMTLEFSPDSLTLAPIPTLADFKH